jgi:GTPase
MFVDQVKVFASAGHGGPGCIAFRRESFAPKGGPSGGNGGRGGSVILRADHDLNNLIGQFYTPRLIAKAGENGLGKGMDGSAGKDLIVRVPCGTLVWKLPSPPAPPEVGQEEDEVGPPPEPLGKRIALEDATDITAVELDLEADSENQPDPTGLGEAELVADLTEDGQEFILCKGGRGGLGNRNFASAARQTPRFAQPGEPGDEGNFRFELRFIADIALVGYPNAGKSTLLAAISKARPKIAAYPFTTLHPQIGIVEYEDFHRLTVCDVPGLIEGAHQNVGLGHAFLRHILRCTTLAIVVDMAGTDGREPWDDYKQIREELALYDTSLVEKKVLVVANKMDEAEAVEKLKQFKRKIRKTPIIGISAAFGEGMENFRTLIREASLC